MRSTSAISHVISQFGRYIPSAPPYITRIILRPLSALSLDEGLNSPCDKNASAAPWKREPISDDICRVCARRFFQFPVMFTNNKKWSSTSWLTMLNSLFSFPTFLLFSSFRLVRSNTWVQWKHLTPERSIDLCLQTFPKFLLLLVLKVTTRSLYPECIANLKLPIDAFYRESRSGVNIAKRNIATGLFGLHPMRNNYSIILNEKSKNLERKSSADHIACFLPLCYNHLCCRVIDVGHVYVC
jgi:hypothetical protein